MRLVIDANILFAVLIKSGTTEDIIFSGKFEFYSPRLIFEEFSKHRDLIMNKTERSREEFNTLMDILRRKIKIIFSENSEEYLREAKYICPDPMTPNISLLRSSSIAASGAMTAASKPRYASRSIPLKSS